MSLGLGFLLVLGKLGLDWWFSNMLSAGPFCPTESHTETQYAGLKVCVGASPPGNTGAGRWPGVNVWTRDYYHGEM